MEYLEYKFADKSTWPRGEWDDEPDKVQWQDEKTGLPCLIVRGSSGSLCGYVGVADGHRHYGRDYSDCDVEVHGGLTFAEFCAEDREHGICHIPGPGEPDKVWWLGFDCAHSGDIQPKHIYKFGDGYARYRNIDYVKGECSRLAAQLLTRE